MIFAVNWEMQGDKVVILGPIKSGQDSHASNSLPAGPSSLQANPAAATPAATTATGTATADMALNALQLHVRHIGSALHCSETC